MKLIFCRIIFFTIASLFINSCGYRFGQSTIPSIYRTITVPYVDGDEDGALTAAIVKEIDQNGTLVYVDRCSELKLQVKLLDLRDQNIGFRYDRNRRGKLEHYIIPTETRLTLASEILVTESCSGKIVLGPLILTSFVDFDHDYYSSRNGINIFSLGQLTDIDAAKDAVKVPLNKNLAKKIVEYINESW